MRRPSRRQAEAWPRLLLPLVVVQPNDGIAIFNGCASRKALHRSVAVFSARGVIVVEISPQFMRFHGIGLLFGCSLS